MRQICLVVAVVEIAAAALFLFGCGGDLNKFNGRYPYYTIHETDFIYDDIDWVYPESKARKKYEEVSSLFEPYFDKKPEKVLAKHEVKFLISEDKPEFCPRRYKNYCKKNDCSCRLVVGKTYPRRSTEIWAKKLLSDGGGMYELRLHYCDLLFPGRPEQKDVEWMKQEEIL